MQGPVVVRPDRRGRLPPTDGSRRASRLAAARRLGDPAWARLAWNERILVRQRHTAHSQLLSSGDLRAVKRSPSPTETMTYAVGTWWSMVKQPTESNDASEKGERVES